MAISLVTVGAKITAAITNTIITALNLAGTSTVVPTSVAGAGVTLSTSGKITLAAASTITLNGCFTSAYDNYQIVIDIPTTSASGGLSFVLRVAGTNDTAANYDRQLHYGFGATSVGAQTLAATSWGISGLPSAPNHAVDMKLFGPAQTQATRAVAVAMFSANPMTAATAAIETMALAHRTVAAYDGFTITASAGTLTGTLRVYGYNNG